MKTASGLTLMAVGAILAFAVTAHPSFVNLQVAGWVMIIIGVAGLFVPRRGVGWLRRRMVRSWTPGGLVRDRAGRVYPPPYRSIEVVRQDEARLAEQAAPAEPADAGLTRETVEEFIEE